MARRSIIDYGAVEGTDCTSAIEAAVSAIQDGDELVIPSGLWKHKKTTAIGLLRITGKTGVTIRLDGTLQLIAQDYSAGGDIAQIEIKNCSRTRLIGEGRVHGNMRALLAGQYTIGERSHCIQAGEGCSDLEITGVQAIEPWGDGLSLTGGNPPGKGERTVVNRFQCHDFGRSGIALQKRLMGAQLSRLTLISGDRGDACIDSEPSSASTPGNMPWDCGDAPRDIAIDGLYAVRNPKVLNGVTTYPVAASFSGDNTAEPAMNWQVRNATIYGDCESTDVYGLVFESSTIYGSPDPSPALLFKKVASAMTLRGLRIYKQTGTAVKMNYQTGGRPEDVLCDDLRLFAKEGIYTERCNRIILRACVAEGSDATKPAFTAKALIDAYSGFETIDCRASGFLYGVRHAGIANGPPLTVRASGNRFGGCITERYDTGNVVNL